MSYKTNPIANRLKLTKGWKFSSFPSKKKNYAPEVIQGLKIYLALSLFLEFKQLKIAKLEIRKTENNMKIIVLTIYRTKRRKIRKKKKSLTKRGINIKLARTNAKKAMNIVYNDITLLKRLSPLRFSSIRKHPFQYKWVSNSKIFSTVKSKRKKLISFLKYKRIKNKAYFKPTEKNLVNTTSGVSWSKPVYFLQKKYKTLLNQAKYYKAKGNHLDKISKAKFFTKNLKKTNEYIIYLKSIQDRATRNHITAAKYFAQASAILYRIKEEHNGLVFKDTSRLLKNNILISKKKKIKYILKNAKISLILLKKNQKYRSFYKKDLLHLISTKIYKNNKKKKYYFDKYNLSIRSAHLDYHIKAIDYALNNTITPSENKKILVKLKILNGFKKEQNIYSFLKLSLFLRKLVLKNIRVFKKKDGIKLKGKTIKLKKTKIFYFVKKNKNTYLNKKNKKTSLKLKSFLDVLRNTNFKNKNYLLKNKSFDKKVYLKQQRILTKFKLSSIVAKMLSVFYSTNVVVKVTNFVESYKNDRIKKKIYSKNKKNKIITILKKKQRFIGKKYKKNKRKLVKPLKRLLVKKIKNSLLQLKSKNSNKIVKEKKILIFFKNAVKKTYLKKLKTILKKNKSKINNPSPWERSEENIYKRIQQVRAEGLKKNQFLSRFIPVLMVLNKTLNAQILADQIAFEFERTKNHWPLISSIRSALNVIRFKKLKGFRIGISGKINASSRTRSVFISKGNLPVQTFSERMNFATSQSRARTGTFGIRIWLYY